MVVYGQKIFCADASRVRARPTSRLSLLSLYNYYMRHYYILTLDPRRAEVFSFIDYHKLRFEVHLNRTRFWVPEGSVLTELVIRFGDCCHYVDETVDLSTGM